MKKIELLAPAGNYECFLGAVAAGADAVYVGGSRFGARAYADNFTEEEICRAIRYAHIHKRKMYLTLNTLVKEREFHEVYDYLLPLYEAGLDGVIIQDIGVFRAVGEWFPLLPRHVSTQMTLTGSLGTAYLKALGAKRIVPARELSLAEIKEIKKETDIEIETFIHGAMCYCYSGQCLFSSMIGGRSGNRGRCAQPCRLPYEAGKTGKRKYPLSLKDMCTIECLGQLIEAGIDSLKIEGRMKSPEYSAGTTGIYRKYIDRYYKNPAEFHVEKQDMDTLQALYIRSGISQGYYHRHNGRNMVTLENPGYTGRDEALAKRVREIYFGKDMRLPVFAEAKLEKGEAAVLSLEWNGVRIKTEGALVQAAKKQPLTEETVRKQLNKYGNTVFSPNSLKVIMSEDIFLPVKDLNDLRRTALDSLEEAVIRANGFDFSDRTGSKKPETQEVASEISEKPRSGEAKTELHVLALTKTQCMAAAARGVRRLYVDSGLCRDTAWLEELRVNHAETKLYLALPYILRQKDRPFLENMRNLLKKNFFSGILVRNLEELQFFKEGSHSFPLVSDAGLYLWNRKTFQVLRNDCRECYIPYELNHHELKDLTEQIDSRNLAISVYGRIPMMISANCIANTLDRCRKILSEETGKENFLTLTDRYGKAFPVYLNCMQCYNVIYNSLPLSHHRNLDKIRETGISAFRLDFTVESEMETEKIIRFWQKNGQNNRKAPPYEEYTGGHLQRGVE